MQNSFFCTLRRLRRARPLANGERGSVAIEFAVLAPVLFTTIIGIIEVSMIMFAQHQMESAAYNASRTGKTGYTEVGKTQSQTILDSMKQRLAGVIDPAQLTMTSKAYANFGKIGQPEPYVDANGNGVWNAGENFTDVNSNGVWDSDQGTSGAGTSAQVVVYTITYPWKIFTPFMTPIFGNNGSIDLYSKIVVRNEPY